MYFCLHVVFKLHLSPYRQKHLFCNGADFSQTNRMFDITTQNASHTLTPTTYFQCLEDKDDVKKM